MYSLDTLLLAAVATLALGLGIGALVSRRLSPDTQRQRELERNLDRLMEQQKDYQHEVQEHFADTAKLLGNLAESYRDVHNHLASGADKLAGTGNVSLLQPLPDGSLQQLTAPANDAPVEQPLDYAPKTSPHEPGILNEEFGLDKVSPSAPEEVPMPVEPVPEKA